MYCRDRRTNCLWSDHLSPYGHSVPFFEGISSCTIHIYSLNLLVRLVKEDKNKGGGGSGGGNDNNYTSLDNKQVIYETKTIQSLK